MYFREQKEEKKMPTRHRTVNSEKPDNELGLIFLGRLKHFTILGNGNNQHILFF